ncbi:MAG: aminopeptidase P N-terminal domain-containing protein [Phycisphaerales bacterium]
MAPTTDAVPAVTHAEHRQRRERLLKELGGAVGLVLAGEADPSLHHPWRPHAHFEYLTGVTDEPGAMLLLDPAHPVAAKRAVLLLKPLNPELEKWDGFRHELGAALRARTGFDTVMRVSMLPRLLLEATRRTRALACLMPLSAWNAPVSGDLAILRAQAERVPGTRIDDRSDLLPRMRAAKSAAEIACIAEAGRITALGFAAAMRSMKAGMNEFDLQEAVEHAYRTGGARELAFRTIAGGGFNATVLHYHANDRLLAAGELVVLDSGARYAGYSADVTRTLPVGGKFSPRQRELYEIVLRAQEAAIAAVKPGATLADIDAAGRAVINDAGLGDAFIHGMGHHLGLETHDASPDAPLEEGAVVTIEPGVYLPGESIGIRIEDDVVATASGPRVLTSAIPKSISDVERAMAG